MIKLVLLLLALVGASQAAPIPNKIAINQAYFQMPSYRYVSNCQDCNFTTVFTPLKNLFLIVSNTKEIFKLWMQDVSITGLSSSVRFTTSVSPIGAIFTDKTRYLVAFDLANVTFNILNVDVPSTVVKGSLPVVNFLSNNYPRFAHAFDMDKYFGFVWSETNVEGSSCVLRLFMNVYSKEKGTPYFINPQPLFSQTMPSLSDFLTISQIKAVYQHDIITIVWQTALGKGNSAGLREKWERIYKARYDFSDEELIQVSNLYGPFIFLPGMESYFVLKDLVLTNSTYAIITHYCYGHSLGRSEQIAVSFGDNSPRILSYSLDAGAYYANSTYEGAESFGTDDLRVFLSRYDGGNQSDLYFKNTGNLGLNLIKAAAYGDETILMNNYYKSCQSKIDSSLYMTFPLLASNGNVVYYPILFAEPKNETPI